jgi:hypothetical protein
VTHHLATDAATDTATDRTTADRTTGSRRAPARRRLGLALMLLAVLLTVGAGVGVFNPSHLVWVERVLHHPYPMLFGGAVLFTVGFRLWSRRVLLRFVVGAVCLASAIGWASAWILSPSDEGAVATAPAPDRGEYEAVVRHTGSDDEPAWRVSVRQTGSLLAREWAVGCVQQSVPHSEFENVRWAGPDRLVVELEEGELDVAVDPRTGRPERGTGPGWTRC